MKRGGPLRRSSPLRRTGLRRRPRKPRPVEGPLDPGGWKSEVFVRARGRSAISGRTVPWFAGEAHHGVRKEALRQRGLHGLVWSPENGVWLSREEHEAHENGSRRIYRDELPESVWRFAETLGGWATVHLERHYPERSP